MFLKKLSKGFVARIRKMMKTKANVLMQGCQCEVAQLPGTEKGIND